MTPEQLDEIEKLAATWLETEKSFYARGRDYAMHQFIIAMRMNALPLVKALREAWQERDVLQAVLNDWQRFGMEREKERDAARKQLEGICSEFEGAVAHADWRAAGSKGMSVPFTGDFASVVQLPGAINKMRWWIKVFRAVLNGEMT